jgi:hypothetical protein
MDWCLEDDLCFNKSLDNGLESKNDWKISSDEDDFDVKIVQN